MKAETGLNCSVGIGSSRLIAKVSSAQAKPNGVLWIVPGEEVKFLAALDVREIPGVGKVMESNLHALGIKKVGDLARVEETELEERFGKWGMALAGKARGEDAGGWFDNAVGAETEAKSISHEHTYNEDIADAAQLESTLMRLCEMVGPPAARRQLPCPHHSTQVALPGFHDHHTRPHPAGSHPAGYGDLRAGTLAVLQELEAGHADTFAGSAGFVIHH